MNKKNIKKAVIVAGGKGTRMVKVARNIPKALIKIGNKTIAEHQIGLLKKHGIKEFFFLSGYLGNQIKKYLGNGRKWEVKIYYHQERTPLGTAGGIKEIEDELKENFLVLMGDIMLNMDIAGLVAFHKNKNSACTLVLHPNDHPQDSDLVEIDDSQRIVAFHPKPRPENKYFRNLVNAGLYVLSPRILRYISKGKKTDFGKDVFPRIIKKEAVYGYTTAEYLKDVGTPERLPEVRRDYLSGKISRLNRSNKRKAIFLDRDGTINKKVGYLYKIDDFKLISGIAKTIKKINDSEFLAIVITNQPVVARGLLSIEGLEEIHKKMETLLGRKGAKLDSIYYCSHHPDKGFPGENKKYKIKCNCRKPKIGMVKKAKKDFNIDLKRSYFIGDSFRDILCGKNAGTITVGVKTGEGCRDCDVKPDYFFDNLSQAVNFIVKKKNK